MTSTTATPAAGSGARVHVQKFGTFLSNMIMPNIGAFIAWGFITALFIDVGWLPNPDLAEMVGPMIIYMIPLLIGYTGGKNVYGDHRGGVVGAIATMGVIVGTDIPMFIGAMIMGPLGGWVIKHFDARVHHRIRPGFEMLVNNFSAGILGMFLAIFGYWAIGPVVTKFSELMGNAVDFLVSNNVLPLTSILIEPAKVLFLNNAINHGVLTPLGTEQALTDGKSILFLLEANPAAGLGLLLAYMAFGKGAARASAPGAAIIHFFGGIHEIYFPYVLMKPVLIVAMIAGGMTQIFVNVVFGTGLVAPAAPGSIFAVYAQTARGSYLGVTLSVLAGAAVTFAVAALLLKIDPARDEGDLAAATSSMESMKGKQSIASASIVGGTATATRQIQNIVFACDAGMGSSAMGASVLRKKIHDAGHPEVTVVNKAISNLDDSYDLVVTHQDLTDRARQKTPSAVHVSVDNFMGSPRYDEIVTMVEDGKNA